MSWAGIHQEVIGHGGRKTCQPSFGYSSSNVVAAGVSEGRPVLVCFSHLRWRFVYQRPQHLMSRFATLYRVVFFEEPLATEELVPWLETREEAGVQVVVPRLPESCTGDEAVNAQRRLLDEHLEQLGSGELIAWYYTPMSLAWSDHLEPELMVYDCMDELSAFMGAPPELIERERELIAGADVVFTGGVSLYEARRILHDNVHAFPSSVDVAHFAAARQPLPEPVDQAGIACPRLGFYGVIDERLDIALLDELARERPDWQFVLVGPVVKIDPASLPRHDNVHYLGGKGYDELPHYLAGWDVALMPFAMNESTRFISPTKTPEYLAGGRPVVSTPIIDVVRSYGHTRLVRIAGTATEFIAAIEAALDDAQHGERMFCAADEALGDMSWDHTWQLMEEQLRCAIQQ